MDILDVLVGAGELVVPVCGERGGESCGSMHQYGHLYPLDQQAHLLFNGLQ